MLTVPRKVGVVVGATSAVLFLYAGAFLLLTFVCPGETGRGSQLDAVRDLFAFMVAFALFGMRASYALWFNR